MSDISPGCTGKKIINEPRNVVDEALQGFTLSNKNIQLLKGHRVLIRRDIEDVRKRGLVTLISGGGSGHEPAHCGFIGCGGLTAVVSGGVFASPPAKSVLAAIRVVSQGNAAGVLLIVKNYTGDRLNFGLAAEQAKQEGIEIDMVVVNEDCALSSIDKTAGRRGLCGTVIIHKIAGAMAEAGKNLDEIVNCVKESVLNMGTIAVTLSACALPGSKPSFHLARDEIELGLGIHGEKGVKTIKLSRSKELVGMMIEHMCTEDKKNSAKFCLRKNDKIGVMVNNLGGTTQLELYLFAKDAVKYLETVKDAVVERLYVGTFMTSLEMAGVSLTLLHLNKERKQFLDYETEMPGWSRTYGVSGEEQEMNGLIKDSDIVEPEEDLTSTGHVLSNCFLKIIENLEDNENYLNELDRLSGDGDCGSTLKCATQAIKASMKKIPWNSPYNALLRVANIIQDTMGGSSGAFYSIFILAGVEPIKNVEDISPLQWCKALECGIEGIKRYGQAEEGDRTMLDALCPASVNFRSALERNSDPFNAFEAAVQAAEEGSQKTAGMKAQAGRASYICSSKLTEPDPGAVAVALWMKAIKTSLT